MALDLTGIENKNEFYSQHYLSSLLEGDLKEFFDHWTAQAKEDSEVKTPWKRLDSLSSKWLNIESKLERSEAKENRKLLLKFAYDLFEALGYDLTMSGYRLDTSEWLPLISAVNTANNTPACWVIASDTGLDGELGDALSGHLVQSGVLNSEQLEHNKTSELNELDIERILGLKIMSEPEPPRWVIVYSVGSITLIDRTKWAEKKCLSFDLAEIFGRRDVSTMKAMSALLHRESLTPLGGETALVDQIDEKSHKHAFGVSEDLKYAVREAIELLGNEAYYYLTNVKGKNPLKKEAELDEFQEQLTHECLRYLYRLLFMFYIESRHELGFSPMKSQEYRLGYSLEKLRELEMVPLQSTASKEGKYIHQSLKQLFKMIFEGYPFDKDKWLQLNAELEAGSYSNTFKISSLKSHLFDPLKTQILDQVEFRNEVLQKVIRLLSLTKTKNGKRRGRVSYAQLGINQLGAVYEGLLSYTGFFARETLYEVRKKGEDYHPLEAASFVTESEIGDYTNDEKLYKIDGKLEYRRHAPGEFIYRLAGRNREKSASYYTPEVLTQCLVKYSLKELLKDKNADEILALTVCEPAMGSGAFLNEGINQLAEAYLIKKQEESGEVIPLSVTDEERRQGKLDYTEERQRVKAYIANNNVYGVDLNTIAVELAEVSIWLNTLFNTKQHTAPVPWFGLRFRNGNSLIGARHQVYSTPLLREKKKELNWREAVPSHLKLSEERSKTSIYHWMLPVDGMAVYKDKVVKQLRTQEIKKIEAWRKKQLVEYNDKDIHVLQELSQSVDQLWQRHIASRKKIKQRTQQVFKVWGQESAQESDNPTIQQCDQLLERELYSLDDQGNPTRNSSPYLRLKLAMDYWCALWFWPIDKHHLLPDRESWLRDLEMILYGKSIQRKAEEGEALGLDLGLEEEPEAQTFDEFGFVNIPDLLEKYERLQLVDDLAKRHKFFHWELEFADVFAEKDGFDLILGNPPWIKVEWNEGGILGEKQPLMNVRKLSASKINDLREETLEKFPALESDYLMEYEGAAGTQSFLNGIQNYPILKKIQTNLYKCFLPLSWMISNDQATQGFVHPEGVYDDPKGGKLREVIYQRLRYHFQFQNAMFLFSEVHDQTKYSINIFGEFDSTPRIKTVSNLFHPSTVDPTLDGLNRFDTTPEMRDVKGKWIVKGHPSRVISIGEKELRLFASLYDAEGTPFLEARLPALHSKELISVLEKFAKYPRKLGDLKGEYYSTPSTCWHELNAQKDKVIIRNTCFPKNISSLIYSGPHFHLANPFYKTPRNECILNCDYDIIDLESLPHDYLPRTNYVGLDHTGNFFQKTPTVHWQTEEGNNKITDFYRLCFRSMVGPTSERTITPSILPRGSTHINGAKSFSFKNQKNLIASFGISCSIISDFFIKSTGTANLYDSILQFLPVFDIKNEIKCRSISLICLTSHYSELWNNLFKEVFFELYWLKSDPRLQNSFFQNLTPKWNRNCALRTDYERRQALVEIDVLVAIELKITLEELITIYRIQFPVLRQNENDTWYDQKGRIIFTCSKGLIGVGLPRKASKAELKKGISYGIKLADGSRDESGIALGWEDAKDLQEGDLITKTFMDDTLPGGPREKTITYYAPFDKCDREADYREVWGNLDKMEGLV